MCTKKQYCDQSLPGHWPRPETATHRRNLRRKSKRMPRRIRSWSFHRVELLSSCLLNLPEHLELKLVRRRLFGCPDSLMQLHQNRLACNFIWHITGPSKRDHKEGRKRGGHARHAKLGRLLVYLVRGRRHEVDRFRGACAEWIMDKKLTKTLREVSSLEKGGGARGARAGPRMRD
jgi:hypothetical protein